MRSRRLEDVADERNLCRVEWRGWTGDRFRLSGF